MNRMQATAVGVVLVAFAASGCSKPDATASGGSATTAAGSGSTAASGAASAKPAAAASAPSVATPAAWSGKYAATSGSMYVPDGGEWSGVKFRGDDASTGLGEGTLDVTIDPSGRAHGKLEGPLGPARVDGVLAGDELTASLVPAEAQGFAGTLVGHADGAKIAGTMRLSSRETANVLRTASFTLNKGGAP
jgi:hypothetical protein